MGCCFSRPADAFKRSKDEPASFYPSSLSLGQSSPAMKGFRELVVSKPYAGEKKILVLCSSEFLLPCMGGKLFNTGHHTTETLVPLYHFDKAGFKFDIATEEGKPVALEEWTFPLAVGYEKQIKEINAKYENEIKNPMKYEDVDLSLSSYAAVFIPGGHGPLIAMAFSKKLGEILRASQEQAMITISLCHGPVAFAAAAVDGQFPYKDFKICVFPDSMDEQSPSFGYLPAKLDEKYKAEAKLTKLGFKVQNKVMDDSTCTDRNLITGASQQASQKTAEEAIKVLAAKFDFVAK